MSQVEDVKKYVAEVGDLSVKLAHDIWGYAELSYTEEKSSAELIEALKAEGFTIETGLAEIPTAFSAKYSVGTGKPVMGLLAEYDALDALSQKSGCTHKEPLVPGAPGHGCGHNLLGAGCFATAVALKRYMVDNKLDGTVVFFGCPAEEGAGSKQFMARAGCFDDVDFCYTWHPASQNTVPSTGNSAIMGANFIFDGIASHAGGAPHLGRSALDGVELMNIGVNYLREHIIDQARVHYAYSNAGGTAPNVVQDHAVIKYEVRAPKVYQMKELFARVANIAAGAAQMTETKMHYDITMAFSDFINNKTLGPVMAQALEDLGTPEWTEEEYAFAKEMLYTLDRGTLNNQKEAMKVDFEGQDIDALMNRPLDTTIHPYDPKCTIYRSGSTDVGDVAYACPTAMLSVATSGIGTVGHSWQYTAFSDSSIGFKGMLKAAEVMMLSCLRTMNDPELIEKAKKEVLEMNGGKYTCPLPETVKPPIGTY